MALRLLAVDVLARAAAQDGRQGVPVRRGGDHRSVDGGVGEHRAEVLHAFRTFAPLTRGILVRSHLVQPAVHVANVGDLAIAAIQETHGQRVPPPAADADHRQHEPVVGWSRPDRTGVAQNSDAGRSERSLPSIIEESSPVEFGHGIGALYTKRSVSGSQVGHCRLG